MVTEIGASVGSCIACSACSCNSFSSSDIPSFSHNFHNHALVSLPVELRVENPLPRAQIELAPGNGYDDFMMDQQRLQVGIAVILTGLMMLVVLAKRSQMLQPLVDVFDQAALIVVDVDARSNVHGRNQHHALPHSALGDDLFYLRRDVYVGSVRLGMKLQIFSKGLHSEFLIGS